MIWPEGMNFSPGNEDIGRPSGKTGFSVILFQINYLNYLKLKDKFLPSA